MTEGEMNQIVNEVLAQLQREAEATRNYYEQLIGPLYAGKAVRLIQERLRQKGVFK